MTTWLMHNPAEKQDGKTKEMTTRCLGLAWGRDYVCRTISAFYNAPYKKTRLSCETFLFGS